MTVRMTPRRWLMGAGAGTMLLLGGIIAGPAASLAGDGAQAQISEDEAAQFAIAEFPGSSANEVELEEEDGLAIYEVTLSNGIEVEVDGNNGQILETERDDADDAEEADDDNGADDATEQDEQEDAVPAGTLDDGDEFLTQASITLDQAIAAAQGAADGGLGEVDLEYVDGQLVFNVDIGDQDVKVDANDGSIVSLDSDD